MNEIDYWFASVIVVAYPLVDGRFGDLIVGRGLDLDHLIKLVIFNFGSSPHLRRWWLRRGYYDLIVRILGRLLWRLLLVRDLTWHGARDYGHAILFQILLGPVILERLAALNALLLLPV